MARDDGARYRHRRQGVDDYPSFDEDERGDGPPALEEVGRGRRGPAPIVWLAVAVIVVFGAAFAGRTVTYISDAWAAPSPTPDAISWIDVLADPSVYPTPAGPPYNTVPCFDWTIDASQRWISVDAWPVAVIVMNNNLDESCYVNGQPTVQMAYEDGSLVDANVQAPAGPPLVLAGHEKAAIKVTFDDVCRTFLKPVEIKVQASVGTAMVKIPPPPGYDARCGSYPPGKPGTFSVGPFEKWPTPNAADLPAVRVAFVDTSAYTAPGATLAYFIDVTNISGRTISLYPCPSYRAYLVGKMVREPVAYRLNCEALNGRLEAGATVRFAMIVDIDPETTDGQTVLVWESLSGFAGAARMTIMVNPPE